MRAQDDADHEADKARPVRLGAKTESGLRAPTGPDTVHRHLLAWPELHSRPEFSLTLADKNAVKASIASC